MYGKSLSTVGKCPEMKKRTRIPAIINRSDEMYDYYNRHWSQEQSNKTKTFAYNLWDMYDNSDIRVVSGNYLKMQTLTLRYSLQPKLLKKTPFSFRFSFFQYTESVYHLRQGPERPGPFTSRIC